VIDATAFTADPFQPDMNPRKGKKDVIKNNGIGSE